MNPTALATHRCIYAIFIGVYIGVSGDRTIRFRPALIFQCQHAELTLDVIESALKEL